MNPPAPRAWPWLLGFVLILAGCDRAPEASSPAPGILATVDGQPVSEESFRYWWAQQASMGDTLAGRESLLEQLIERTALAQAARQAGLERDPIIREQMEHLLIARLRETRLQPRLDQIAVPESELIAYYEAHRLRAFTQPERLRVAVLWFNTRGQDALAARFTPRLESIREQLLTQTGAPAAQEGFGPLALANSEHRASRFQGGDMGWLEAKGETDPWRAVVADLASHLHQMGDLSPVTACPQGLFLVRLMERHPEQVQPFETVRERIRDRLMAERRQACEGQFHEEILQAATIKRDLDQLGALRDLPQRETPTAPPGPPQFTARRP